MNISYLHKSAFRGIVKQLRLLLTICTVVLIGTVSYAGTDGDGIPDATDLDDDNDGIRDVVEDANLDLDSNPYTNPTDTDGDGIWDIHDLDSDGDGIFDIAEAGGVAFDMDLDGRVDGFTDTDMDGWHDAFASSPLPYPNSDYDALPDARDADSDGDGIPDAIEGRSSYTYTPPLGFDTDGDGIDDAFDSDNGGSGFFPQDLDMDSRYDYLDLDSDNDNENDSIEGHDTNGDGNPEQIAFYLDADGDGIDNAFDSDMFDPTNNGGAHNGGQLPVDFPDVDLPGIGEPDWREFDNDADGINNYQDEDDDNDGIPDYVEVCGSGATGWSCMDDPILDNDDDGLINYRDVNYGELNSKGVTAILDHDNDGIIDMFDRDSDNDGLPDVIETGRPDNDNNGKIDEIYADGTLMYDADLNGLTDTLAFFYPRNIDSLGGEDYRDLDSDNDGMYDIYENGGIDDDFNGLTKYIASDSSLLFDSNDDGFTDTLGFYQVIDTDGDGLGDYTDLDSDNDGLSDLVESGGTDNVIFDGMIDAFGDADGDGADDDQMITAEDWDNDSIPDYRDFDTDNDLIADVEEVGNEDNNGDGKIDAMIDANLDGWSDDKAIVDPTNTDGDANPDFKDLDSDGDGIYDIVEGGKLELDANENGKVDSALDLNGDGWHDSDHLSTNNVPNTDGTGGPDYQDVDADGDGTPDNIEYDADGDGVVPDDCDEDGVYDWLDPDFCDIAIPQGFSPNGDGINDVLVLNGTGYYPEGKLIVFNRAGQKVYEAINYQNDWDGANMFAKDDGSVLCPTGTYFYVFEPERTDGNGVDIQPTTGYIYLSR